MLNEWPELSVLNEIYQWYSQYGESGQTNCSSCISCQHNLNADFSITKILFVEKCLGYTMCQFNVKSQANIYSAQLNVYMERSEQIRIPAYTTWFLLTLFD